MQWDDVRILAVLLHAGTAHEAASRLGLDRSTISRRVAALERALGARLFVRTREGLRPTAAAERLRPHAEAMAAEAQRLAQRAAASEARVTGTVRVATTEAMGAFLVAQGLLGLREAHPELVVELLGGNRPVELTRGEADVALRSSALREPSLRARCIARLGLGLFASHAYVRSRGTPRSPSALRGHDVIVPSAELARLPEARWLEARDEVRVVFRSSSMPALVAAAVAGHGVVPLSLPWGEREPELERLMTLDEIPKRPLWLVTHVESSARPAVRVVCERVASIFARAVPATPARR